MSDKQEWYAERDPPQNLYGWAFKHMAMGAVYAGLVLFGIIAILVLLRAVSFILPEDPFAVLQIGTQAVQAVV